MIECRVKDEELAIVNLTRELSQAKIQRTNQRAYYEDAVFNLHNYRVSFRLLLNSKFNASFFIVAVKM